MKEKYLFDSNVQMITIEVKIGTPGLANTQIYKRGNGDETVKIGESPIENANVEEVSLGDLTKLEKKSIAVQTIINFGTIEKKLWPQLLKTVSSQYVLKDNLGNKKTYSHDVDDIIVSNDGKTVFIIKLFNFQRKSVLDN
ncbi:MAG TPA: hypothetical protein VIN10_03915 [Bacteroidales bacterium]